MQGEKRPRILCKSVFQQGETSISKERFTQMWLHVAQQLEENQGQVLKATGLPAPPVGEGESL